LRTVDGETRYQGTMNAADEFDTKARTPSTHRAVYLNLSSQTKPTEAAFEHQRHL
jgi:hypothetical protein